MFVSAFAKAETPHTLNLQLTFIHAKRPFPFYASFYTAKYALSSDGVYQRIFEYKGN
ncbi:hypothetical protein DDD_3289 [Nonlabens dokdonensis DSW-6]|uniref:Uncharacterized protein n=1 Tax=Nonlabens dokdonensis (strain DSM 17205 / KCTC 12402 / DSW-6) TaxID=592029 RepID=L7WEQ9_NONDD|nr:hypothetical protein DDD_3289 [Nonlabens dokdonensis DSW-6]